MEHEEFILENEDLKVTISTDGAQIYSIIYKEDGSERMWNGNEKYWAQRSPILFPQVGNTHDKKQVFKGKECHLGNHGFARHAKFSLAQRKDDQLTLYIEDDEKTYEDYPYHFRLEVTYRLIAKKLEISYRIFNKDEATMPFGFGLHPAFNCPIYAGERFEDYHLEFSSKEKDDTEELKLIEDHKIDLSYEIFKKFPTVIYKDLVSNWIKLSNGSHGVTVAAVGYPFWGIWTPNGPFICIEPWFSHGDREVVDVPFEKREGVINLESGKTFYTAYSIEIF